MADASGDYIKFLGTAGARFVMITQRRSSAGVLYSLGGFRLLVDPGPGCLVRCHASRPRGDPSKLDAVLLTHGHLDHAGDVNVMLEAMTEGGHEHRGTLYAPSEALDGDPIVMRYVRRYVGRIEVLEEGKSWGLAPGVTLTTPVRHLHGGEAYGLRLQTPRVRISHVADTFYFPELVRHYAPCDVLIVHMVLYQVAPERKKRILHMDLADATRLVAEVRPRMALLTHFGMTVLDAKPWLLAEKMSAETGVRVVAARDGMTFDLEALETHEAAQDA